MKFRWAALAACGALLALAAAAQTAPVPQSPATPPVSTITFDLVFPGAQPAHYRIVVDSSGQSSYRSDDDAGPAPRTSPATPGTLPFTMSEATRSRIFALARQLNYFQGNYDYTRHRVANTGVKTLTYREGPDDSPASANGPRHSTTYNYSDNPAIQQITAIFQGIGVTAELAGRLEHLRRFDRLGLDAELRHAEEMARSGQLLELQLAVPALRAVADDPATLRLTRERARRLLQLVPAAVLR
jgi:hypothetical protein